MAARLGHAVELALLEIATADQRDHFVGSRVDRQQRSLDLGSLVESYAYLRWLVGVCLVVFCFLRVHGSKSCDVALRKYVFDRAHWVGQATRVGHARPLDVLESHDAFDIGRKGDPGEL